MFEVTRYHDISCGHRVVGHESKCRHLHGHNYRIHFTCVADNSRRSQELGINNAGLDQVGRVIDFSVIKEKLCMWVENNWDHQFLAWEEDSFMQYVETALDSSPREDVFEMFDGSVVWTPFNPTAENMARYLVETVGPSVLAGTGVILRKVLIEETAKCHASYYL